MKINLRTFKYAIVNAIATIVEGEKDGEIIDYGKKNTLPNEIILTVDGSGTATECLDKVASFLEADGFKEKTVSTKIITKSGKTADQFLSDIVSNVSYFNGYYGLIQFGIDGMPVTIDRVPFETVRKVKGGGFKVNKKFGSKDYKKLESQFFNEYDPKEDPAIRIERIAKYKDGAASYPGEIIFTFMKRTGKDIYPVPKFYSSIEDLLSEAGLVKLENRNINDGFRPGVILEVSRMDNSTVDDKGKTESSRFDETINEFIGPEAAPVMVIETDNPGGPGGGAKATVFPLGDMLDGVDKARDRVPRTICRAIGVPPSIIGLSVPEGLGNQQALANSMKLFNLSNLKLQNLISTSLKSVFPDLDWTLTTLNIIQYIDPTIIGKLTDDEIRGLIGYAPLPKEGTTGNKSLAEIIGVGGVTSMKEIIADPVMEKPAKVQFLIVVFALTEINANKLVYGQDTAPVIIPPTNPPLP